MAGECYRPDEILHLDGNEPHLSQCPTCRSLFARGQMFLEEVRRSAGQASAIGSSWQAAQSARKHLNKPAGSPGQEDPATPEMVLACCGESRNALLRSPNEAQRWLETAQKILSKIPATNDPWRAKDHRWAAARVKASWGNLLVFRGEVLTAHDLLEEARAEYEAMGEEFQTALAARSLAYTLSKLGRILDAKALCREADQALVAYGAEHQRHGLLSAFALVQMATGEPGKARQIFEYLEPRLDPDDPYTPTIRRNAILPDLEEREWDRALSRIRALVEEWGKRSVPLEMGRGLRLQGEILLLMGHAREARNVLKQALAVLEPLDVRYDRAQALALRGQAEWELGHRRLAANDLREALAYYQAERFGPDLLALLEAWTEAVQAGQPHSHPFQAFRSYWRFGQTLSFGPHSTDHRN